jgi:hypothetical protein
MALPMPTAAPVIKALFPVNDTSSERGFISFMVPTDVSRPSLSLYHYQPLYPKAG